MIENQDCKIAKRWFGDSTAQSSCSMATLHKTQSCMSPSTNIIINYPCNWGGVGFHLLSYLLESTASRYSLNIYLYIIIYSEVSIDIWKLPNISLSLLEVLDYDSHTECMRVHSRSTDNLSNTPIEIGINSNAITRIKYFNQLTQRNNSCKQLKTIHLDPFSSILRANALRARIRGPQKKSTQSPQTKLKSVLRKRKEAYKWNGYHQHRDKRKECVGPFVRQSSEHLFSEQGESHGHDVSWIIDIINVSYITIRVTMNLGLTQETLTR